MRLNVTASAGGGRVRPTLALSPADLPHATRGQARPRAAARTLTGVLGRGKQQPETDAFGRPVVEGVTTPAPPAPSPTGLGSERPVRGAPRVVALDVETAAFAGAQPGTTWTEWTWSEPGRLDAIAVYAYADLGNPGHAALARFAAGPVEEPRLLYWTMDAPDPEDAESSPDERTLASTHTEVAELAPWAALGRQLAAPDLAEVPRVGIPGGQYPYVADVQHVRLERAAGPWLGGFDPTRVSLVVVLDPYVEDHAAVAAAAAAGKPLPDVVSEPSYLVLLEASGLVLHVSRERVDLTAVARVPRMSTRDWIGVGAVLLVSLALLLDKC